MGVAVTYVLGVDLGTTFTAAAVSESGGVPRMMSLGSNAYAVPSVVFLKEDGTFLAGEAAELQSSSDATRVARYFKRRLGDDIPVRLAGNAFDPRELVTVLLGWVLGEVTKRQGEAPEQVVLTHPANWGSFRTEMLTDAARAAGVETPLLVSEPEAAAIHYVQAERLEVGEIIGVYDLGGGTFDAVVMRRTDAGFEGLGRPVGVERLGGVDFDEVIRDFAMTAADLTDVESSDETVSAAYALQASCVTAKQVLSADTVAHVRVMFPGVTTSVRINRAEFEDGIRPRLEDTLTAFDTALRSANLEAESLSRILLVGGSSRIPLVSSLLSQRFGRPLAIDTDPKNTVALGAAFYGTTTVPDSTTVPTVEPASVQSESSVPQPSSAELPPMAAGDRVADPRLTQRLTEPIIPAGDPVDHPPLPSTEALPSTETVAARRRLDTSISPIAPDGSGPETLDEANDLLSVAAESDHRARIPQPTPVPETTFATTPESADAEAVGPSRILLIALIAILAVVAAGVVTLVLSS
jgi:molecular chaperone DnaK